MRCGSVTAGGPSPRVRAAATEADYQIRLSSENVSTATCIPAVFRLVSVETGSILGCCGSIKV